MVVCQSYYKVIGFFSLLKDQNLTTWNICALAFPEHACVEQHFHVSLPPAEARWVNQQNVSIFRSCLYGLGLTRVERKLGKNGNRKQNSWDRGGIYTSTGDNKEHGAENRVSAGQPQLQLFAGQH